MRNPEDNEGDRIDSYEAYGRDRSGCLGAWLTGIMVFIIMVAALGIFIANHH